LFFGIFFQDIIGRFSGMGPEETVLHKMIAISGNAYSASKAKRPSSLTFYHTMPSSAKGQGKYCYDGIYALTKRRK